MATASSSYNTADRIIRMAMEDAGLLDNGAVPTSEQYAKNLQRLQDVANFIQARPGAKLWLLQDVSIPLTQGVRQYTVGPTGSLVMSRPWSAEEAYFLDANGNRVPVDIVSWKDYLQLPQVSQGPINQIQIDKQVNQLVVNTWLAPDATTATGTLHVLFKTQATQYTSLTDATGFALDSYMVLRAVLADELSVGQPQDIQQRNSARAQSMLDALDAMDTENASVFFAPRVR